MKIASCIVDVPHMQTNKLYDYIIPSHLEELAVVGTRIFVPFGNRKVQAFLLKVHNEVTREDLKEIAEVLDYEPVLTEEMIELAKDLAETTVCYYITALQAMLPAALKVKATKYFSRNEEYSLSLLPPPLQRIFEEKNTVSAKEIEDTLSAYKISQLLKENLLSVSYLAKNKIGKKYEKFVQLAVSKEEIPSLLEKMDKKAKKQIQAMHALYELEGSTWPQAFLQNTLSISPQIIKSLEKKNIILIQQKELYRNFDEDKEYTKTTALELTDEQKNAMEVFTSSLRKSDTCLLFGVTGSGRTEVYLQLIDQVINRGEQAIVLVPEIALTPLMVNRFKGRFGTKVAVLHSGLSLGEKYDEWRKILRGEVYVVVGARSAVFAPFKKVGVIIIDEEHESSYKQEDHPKYHARDVAKWRSDYHQCPVILGSATPSLETFARAKKGVYKLVTMKNRMKDATLPTVKLVDMRDELREGNRSMFSKELVEGIKERLEKKEQMVLFLNRRGHSTYVFCRECGYSVMCPNCDVTLTYHRVKNSLKCHYCAYEEQMCTECPKCKSEHIRFFGVGTQKVEEELFKLFPEARVIRMDVDTTSKKGSHEALLHKFGNHEADILLGTQMIAKGLDFPLVTLVGVLNADTMLHIPDFRSSEKTFQLLTQVSGRAGRHHLPGEVVIQTYLKEHFTIELCQTQDYEAFFNEEMKHRRSFYYPPYSFLALVTVSHENPNYAYSTLEKIAKLLREKCKDQIIFLGPNPSPITKIKNQYRFQLMMKHRKEKELSYYLTGVLDHFQSEIQKKGLSISIDMQPYHVM